MKWTMIDIVAAIMVIVGLVETIKFTRLLDRENKKMRDSGKRDGE